MAGDLNVLIQQLTLAKAEAELLLVQPPPAPTISNFTATPSSLPAGGGSVTFDATVTNANTVTLNGTPVVAFPVTLMVTTSGSFALVAVGSTAPNATASVSVTVAVAPPVGDLSWFLGRAPNTITNIGTEQLWGQNPWPIITPSFPNGNAAGTGGFNAILAASGMAFCPWRGRAGTIVAFGGGHDDYHGNDVYEFDLFAQVWSQLKPPNWPLFRQPNQYHADTNNGEHWADSTYTTTRQDQPSSGHNYGQIAAITPNAQFSQGAVITTCRPSLTPLGQRGGQMSHAFDFATNTWARFSTNNMPDALGYGGCFVDKARNTIVAPLYGGLAKLDLNTRTWTKMLDLPSGLIHMVWSHNVASDVYMGFVRRSGVSELWCVDAATKGFTKPGISGTWPTPNLYDGGSCWSELLGGIAHYHGKGESIVSVMRPPATGNVRTTPWPVSAVTLTGATPVNDILSGAGAHCARFLEHKDAGGFVWLGAVKAPVQFFKV